MKFLDSLISWVRGILGMKAVEQAKLEPEAKGCAFKIEGQNVVELSTSQGKDLVKEERVDERSGDDTKGLGEIKANAAEALPSREQQHAAQVQSLQATLKMSPQQLSAEQIGAAPAPLPAKSRLRLKVQESPAARSEASELEALREETRGALRNLNQAPAMGWLANNLLVLMRRNDVDLSEVVEAISKDPAIFTRILRMANSPVVAPNQRVSDLKTAVSLLGIHRVRLTAQALVTMQETSSLVEGFNWRHLWIHSFACALLAAEIPKSLNIEVPPNAYLAGLLHDMGKILLSYLNPPKYRQLLMEAVCDGTPLHELEIKHFGMTHEEAGAEFGRLSKLPNEVVLAIEHHATPEQAQESQTLVACISVANYLAKTHGLGFSGSSLSSMEENLGETEGWKILSSLKPRGPSAEDFHLQLRPFIADLKQELHSWAAGKKERKKAIIS